MNHLNRFAHNIAFVLKAGTPLSVCQTKEFHKNFFYYNRYFKLIYTKLKNYSNLQGNDLKMKTLTIDTKFPLKIEILSPHGPVPSEPTQPGPNDPPQTVPTL